MQIIHKNEISAIFQEQVSSDRLRALEDLLHSFKTFRKVSLAGYSEDNKLNSVKLVVECLRKYGCYETNSLGAAIGFIDPKSTHHEKYEILDLPFLAISELKLLGFTLKYIH